MDDQELSDLFHWLTGLVKCVRLPSPVYSAADLEQDVLLDLARRPELMRACTLAQAKKWAGTVLGSKVADMHRREGRAKRDRSHERPIEHSGVGDELVDWRKPPSWFARLNEESAIAWEAAKNLTPDQQEVLRLKYNEGLTQAEIARRLNVTAASVSKLHERALRQLRKLLPPPP